MNSPEAKQHLLFRTPAAAAFQAFVDPAVTTRFWFTHSNGPLVADSERLWEWRMYGVSTPVRVLDIVQDRRILIEWGSGETRSQVEWTFEPRPNGSTFVTVRNFGFCGDAQSAVAKAIDSMGGFSLMLANAKAFLEHRIDLRLMVDHAPDALVTSYRESGG